MIEEKVKMTFLLGAFSKRLKTQENFYMLVKTCMKPS